MTAAASRAWWRPSRRSLACGLALVTFTVGMGGTPTAAAAEGVQSKQWYLDAMHADEIWKKTTGKGIKVAVIDTGVNASTPSLKGQVLPGLDAADVKGDETDDYTGHGTTIAELIAGTGKGGGLKGLAPSVKIIPYRISNTDLQNREAVNGFDQRDAIRAAADSDAQIINMSFGTIYRNPQIREAVEYAERKGKLFFAAVGNNAKKGNEPSYPAAYRQVVGIAASSPEGRVSDYSQHGDSVELAAPGDDIPYWCDSSFKRYCDGNGGTSAATAIASASAALIWSIHPDWTANQVLRVMFESAGRGEDGNKTTLSEYYGHGIVRPNAHINRGLGKPGDPDVSPLTGERTDGSPAPSTPTAPGSSQAPKGKPGADAVVAGSGKSAEDDGQLGLIVGGVVAVVVLAAGAFVLARRRRTS
ncbi:S8 family serine peptidase [Streptomyces sp. NPDC059169]|uniref:S8 family serine peptidase n=1 Tax=Streptomyces sp. NPDC059169 TaxID=3346754 RepID=UPI0036C4CB53